MTDLRAPFPYYGYKGQVSSDVWRLLGNVSNYVEPFAGSLAVLLQRPGGAGKREVVNDRHGLLCNFWRSVKHAPEATAEHAVWVCSESDLHARNAACREALDTLTPRLEGDPEYYDAKLAGWWCYVQCLAIGEAAYARGPWVRRGGLLVNGGSEAQGIRRAVPCDSARGIQRAIPFHSEQGLLRSSADALAWLQQLSERLVGVRILCGDWSRAVKPTYTTQHGVTGVYLDPPYVGNYQTYRHHDTSLLDELCSWCLEMGDNPQMRIVMSGYADTLPVDLVANGWREDSWVAKGGRITTGGQSDANRHRERLWSSPHCRGEGAHQLELCEIPGGPGVAAL